MGSTTAKGTSASNTGGWVVVLAGTGINLALGGLYSWSVIAKVLTAKWGWTAAGASIPYAVACGVFAIMMVVGGRLHDKFGPRLISSVGGALFGLGLILASFATKTNHLLMIVGFGVVGGTGIGFGYACATPPALKWFSPAKKGLISGIVVSGFGLASVYVAPTTENLLRAVGVNQTFFILGIAFFIATVLLSQLQKNPPAGYVPAGIPTASTSATAATTQKKDYDWHEMIKTPQFYALWLMFAFASFAGLMIIGHMAKIAAKQLPGVNLGFMLVAILAVGNAAGRIGAGVVSDKLGRVRTMLIVFLGQALAMGLLHLANTTLLLVVGAFVIGFLYGANLSLFPSATSDYFGTKNLGVNYGLVFTSWGVGGAFGSMVAGSIVDATKSYNAAFLVAAGLLIGASALTFLTKAPKARMIESPVLEPNV